MAKKKRIRRRLTPQQRRRRKIRRLKRRIRNYIIVGVVLGGIFFFIKPEAIPNETIRDNVSSVRTTLFTGDEENPGKIPAMISSASAFIEEALKTTKIPKNFSMTDEEIVVDEVVKSITEEVKQLPANQVKKVKVRFCQDVINEATNSATSNQ